MASQQLIPAPLPSGHPPARPGYGKRLAPGQSPRTADDFAHLPRREAAIAGYIDRLPEGADISVKTLAKQLADYGQCALRTALNELSRAGHLRRHREAVIGANGQQRWIWRTHWSRAARDNSWWNAFTSGSSIPAQPGIPPKPGVSAEPSGSEEREEPEGPERTSALARTVAYDILARLGRVDPRLTLSEPECRALTAEAGLWLERGAGQAQLVQALTAGLPPVVAVPYRFVRARLRDKLPPELPRPRRVMECTDCGVPGEPSQLPDGLCRACRGEMPPAAPPGAVPPERIRARVDELRTAMRPDADAGAAAGTVRD
ncbi:hypothetical protein [Streptomyces sp. NPDC088400]|uniref:hypothetical protein n=1 Tax=Streptomyces sp. NPDC088400 TaxID=3365861 RepID=UPI0038269374